MGYDEDMGTNWVISTDAYDGTFDDNMEWDSMHKNIMSKSGKQVKKRCMNLFGRQLCLCQFLDFIDAQSADHLCYPMKPKLTKKASKKYQKLLRQEKKKEKELAKM